MQHLKIFSKMYKIMNLKFCSKIAIFFCYWNESVFVGENSLYFCYFYITFIFILYLKMTMYYNYFQLIIKIFLYLCTFVILNFCMTFYGDYCRCKFLEILKRQDKEKSVFSEKIRNFCRKKIFLQIKAFFFFISFLRKHTHTKKK